MSTRSSQAPGRAWRPRALAGLHHQEPERNTGDRAGFLHPKALRSPLTPRQKQERPACLDLQLSEPHPFSLKLPFSPICPFSGTAYHCPSANCQLSCHSHKHKYLIQDLPSSCSPELRCPRNPENPRPTTGSRQDLLGSWRFTNCPLGTATPPVAGSLLWACPQVWTPGWVSSCRGPPGQERGLEGGGITTTQMSHSAWS